MKVVEAKPMDEVKGHQQIEHEDGEVSEHAAGQRRREEAVGEHAQVDHRRRRPPFPALKAKGERNAGDHQGDRCGRLQTPRGSLAQDQEKAQQGERAQESADQVKLGAIATQRHVGITQEKERQQDAGDAKRDAHQEQASPRRGEEHEGADQRTDGQPGVDENGVDPECQPALRWWKRPRHDRRRHGKHHRAAQPLDGAAGQQPAEARTEAAGERAERENAEPDHVQPLRAHQVAEASEGHQQGGDHERVGHDDPFGGGHRLMEGARDCGQSD